MTNQRTFYLAFFKIFLIQTRSLHLPHCHLRHSALLVSSRDHFESYVWRAGLDFRFGFEFDRWFFSCFRPSHSAITTHSSCRLSLQVINSFCSFSSRVKAFVSPSSPGSGIDTVLKKPNVQNTAKNPGRVYAPIYQLMQEYQAAVTSTQIATNTYGLQVR